MDIRKMAICAAVLCAGVAAMAGDSVPAYTEKWRPQYHFTPAHRWIGDPCGLVHHDGVFHAYSWGAAESTDLLHWNEINREAIEGIPAGVSPFTGSVVVDSGNTAGYGRGAYIAAFTSFDQDSKKQSQSIAFSRDKGRTFSYYDLNPVIDIWSTEFRDPTVLWNDRSGRWIMLVAKALEKKVAFYGSADMKHWEWLSEFGPAGDSEKSWECPDMFKLPVEGTGEWKWVLLVSVNWAREQYFVGDFDGTSFVADNPGQAPQYVDEGLDYYASRTFRDFDGTLPAVYSLGWVSTWDYAQHVPTEYGKGVWSLPRELSLRPGPDGLKLVQTPAAAVAGLRGKGVGLSRRLKAGTTALPHVSRMGNCYCLSADFKAMDGGVFGLNLCAGNGYKVTLGYDVTTGTLWLDRTCDTGEDIPKFARMAYAKVAPVDGRIKLDVYVDKSVLEVFADGGGCVMTALVFPPDGAEGAGVFSHDGRTDVKLTAWPMNTVWDESAPQSGKR